MDNFEESSGMTQFFGLTLVDRHDILDIIANVVHPMYL